MLCETQSVSPRIWTRVAVSISYDDRTEVKTDNLIPARRQDQVLINKKKEIVIWCKRPFQ